MLSYAKLNVIELTRNGNKFLTNFNSNRRFQYDVKNDVLPTKCDSKQMVDIVTNL